MNVVMPKSTLPTNPPIAVHSQREWNMQHSDFVWCADADQPDNVLVLWLQNLKKKVQRPVLLARFTEEGFSNTRLEALLDLGFDGFVIGSPSWTLVEKISTRINGNIIRASKKFGLLRLQGDTLYRGSTKVTVTPKELQILRLLLEARGQPVRMNLILTQLGCSENAITHLVESHVCRLRINLNTIGLFEVIPKKEKGCYRLIV